MDLLDLGNRAIRRMLKTRGVESATTTIRGHHVHYYRARGTGSGSPILLVHGLGSSANAYFRSILLLRKHFSEVWAIDLPGNGFSEFPSKGALPVLEYVDVLLDFRRQLIGQPVTLVGNSLGGGIALYAADKEPEALKALILASPAGARMTEERLAETLQSFRLSSTGDARKLMHKLFAKPPLPFVLFPQTLKKMMGRETVQSILKEVGVKDTVTEQMLSRLSLPTLVLWGQQEKLLPYDGIDYFRAHLPRSAEIQEVRQFGHMPQMEHPDEFVERVALFAQRHGLTS